MLLLSEEQTGKAWEPYNQQCSGNLGELVRKVYSLSFKGLAEEVTSDDNLCFCIRVHRENVKVVRLCVF